VRSIDLGIGGVGVKNVTLHHNHSMDHNAIVDISC
jgi:hypothetical protein